MHSRFYDETKDGERASFNNGRLFLSLIDPIVPFITILAKRPSGFKANYDGGASNLGAANFAGIFSLFPKMKAARGHLVAFPGRLCDRVWLWNSRALLSPIILFAGRLMRGAIFAAAAGGGIYA